MSNPVKRILISLLAISIGLPATAFATNGYFLIGFGSKSRGMGGVGVAFAQDGLAAAANPAGMADVDFGAMRMDVGVELFNPPRAVKHRSSALGDTDEKSGANLFLIPNLGGIYRFNRNMTIGMAAIGAGLGTRYHQDLPGNPTCFGGNTSGGTESKFFNFNCNADSTTVGVMLMQMQMLPSIAYRMDKHHTIGGSIALAAQLFRAYGLGAFESLGFAASNEKVSGEGNDFAYGAGFRLGYLGKFFDDRFKFGANYASRVYMTKFDKYKNLFAEQGGFDIPEHISFGVAFQPIKKLTIAADIQKIFYSNVRSIGNPGPNTVDASDLNPLCPGDDNQDPKRCKLGGNDGMGFGWQDQMVYKIGLNYDMNSKLSVRLGYNYGKSPIPDDQVLFNFLAPATVEHHATVGASYRSSKSIEWSVNYMHAFENTIKGPTAFGPQGGNVVGENAAISMKQHALGVSFSFQM